MSSFNIKEIGEKVITQKKKGISIRKILASMGIPRSTFYKWAEEYNIKKWEDFFPKNKTYIKEIEPKVRSRVRDEKQVTKRDLKYGSERKKDLCGGNLSTPNKSWFQTEEDTGLKLNDSEKRLEKL